MISGAQKNRGETPKAWWSKGLFLGLNPDEYAVMRFLEGAYRAGQDVVTKDAIFDELKPHAFTSERISGGLKRLSKRGYVRFIDDRRDRVSIRRGIHSRELPERLITVENGIRKVHCPPAFASGYGYDGEDVIKRSIFDELRRNKR